MDRADAATPTSADGDPASPARWACITVTSVRREDVVDALKQDGADVFLVDDGDIDDMAEAKS